MTKKVILLSATELEIKPTLEFLEINGVTQGLSKFEFNKMIFEPIITGVGSPFTCYALAKLAYEKSDIRLIHAGISGSYDREVPLGKVFEVTKEKWADLGAEDANGNTLDLFDLELMSENQFPFKNGWINKKNETFQTTLPKVSGLTVNRTTGTNESLQRIKSKYDATLESMEGAAVFYSCRMRHFDFISVRSVSNYVETRNKKEWNIELAVNQLNFFLIDFISQYHWRNN